MISTLRRLLGRFLGAATGACLAVVFLVVLTSSISRYAFDAPFVWSEELAKYAMIYGVAFGSALAYLQAGHIRFAILFEMLPPRAQGLLALVTDLAALALGLLLIGSGILFIAKRGALLSSGLDVPMGTAQGAVLLAGLGIALVALLNLFTPREAAS